MYDVSFNEEQLFKVCGSWFGAWSLLTVAHVATVNDNFNKILRVAWFSTSITCR